MQPDLAIDFGGQLPAICGGIVWQSAPVKEIYRFLFAHFVQPDLAGKMPANCRPFAGQLPAKWQPFFLSYLFFLSLVSK